MNDETRSMSASSEYAESQADGGAPSRFGAAAVLSCIVNALFLIGASALLTPNPDRPSGSEHPLYITLVDDGIASTTSRPLPTPVQQSPPTEIAPSSIPLSAPLTPRHVKSRQQPSSPASSRPVGRPRISSKPSIINTAPATIHSPTETPSLPIQQEEASQPIPQQTAGREGTEDASAGKGEPGGSHSDDSGTATAPLTIPEATPGSSSTPSAPASNGPADSKPSGPTRDAQITSQILPEIPSYLNEPNLKTFVRVKIEIDTDGNFITTLSTSSGNPQIDVLVLNALKRWRWKPALKDGQPVASTQTFRFDFEIQ